MIPFVILAGLLVIVAVAILLPPLLRQRRAVDQRRDSADQARSTANLNILRDQLAELQQERADGTLADADLAQAEVELKRRLLEEAIPHAPAAASPVAGGPARKTAISLLVLLPLLAFAGYAYFGNPKALDPEARVEKRVTAEQIEGMVQKLSEKLKANPDDAKGWLMLARSYKVLQRFAEASDAYGHASQLVDSDPSLLADWAEIAVRAANGNFAGQPDKLIARALKLNPEEPQALLLAGASAGQRGDNLAAANFWEKLLPQVEPGSEEEKTLKDAIGKARAAGNQGKRR